MTTSVVLALMFALFLMLYFVLHLYSHQLQKMGNEKEDKDNIPTLTSYGGEEPACPAVAATVQAQPRDLNQAEKVA